jgi:septin family protein
VYYRFKGGKGIATTIGMFFVADYVTGLVLFGIMFITLYFIKIGSVVSLLFITIMAVVQLFKNYMEDNWIAIVCMIAIVVLDYWAHRQNFLRLIENRENAADLQEGLKKDIEKIKQKKERKLEKNELKQERIEQKYDEKINRKNEKLNKKLEKLAEKENSTEDTAN